MTYHLEPRRDLFQDLSDVRAEFGKAGAAAARADRPRIMHDLLARQMIGQWPPHRLTPFARWLIRRALWCCTPRFTFLEILERQLELRDLNVEFFRRAPKLHAPQLGELRLVLFDPQMGAGQLGPRFRQFRLALGQQRAQLGDFLNRVGSLWRQPRVYTRGH
jgi:hypothetical protein